MANRVDDCTNIHWIDNHWIDLSALEGLGVLSTALILTRSVHIWWTLRYWLQCHERFEYDLINWCLIEWFITRFIGGASDGLRVRSTAHSGDGLNTQPVRRIRLQPRQSHVDAIDALYLRRQSVCWRPPKKKIIENWRPAMPQPQAHHENWFNLLINWECFNCTVKPELIAMWTG